MILSFNLWQKDSIFLQLCKIVHKVKRAGKVIDWASCINLLLICCICACICSLICTPSPTKWQGLKPCWAILKIRDRYPSIINWHIYPLTHQFSKFSKCQFGYLTMILKKMKISKNWPKSCHLKNFKELVLVYSHDSHKIWESWKIGQRTASSLPVLSWKLLVFQGFWNH